MTFVYMLSGASLALEVWKDGPEALGKFILKALLPADIGLIVDAAELAFMAFDLNGNYQGVRTYDESQIVSGVKIANMDSVRKSMSTYSFPELADLQFAKLKSRHLATMPDRKLKKL